MTKRKTQNLMDRPNYKGHRNERGKWKGIQENINYENRDGWTFLYNS
jgi:hypothetical protein